MNAHKAATALRMLADALEEHEANGTIYTGQEIDDPSTSDLPPWEPAPIPAAQPAYRTPTVTQIAAPPTDQYSTWLCPVHHKMKVVPAGVSKRTQKPYVAFYACPEAGCNEKGNIAA